MWQMGIGVHYVTGTKMNPGHPQCDKLALACRGVSLWMQLQGIGNGMYISTREHETNESYSTLSFYAW